MNNISDDIQYFLPTLLKKEKKTFNYKNIQNLQLIIGGAAHLSRDLIREGFKLLNNHRTNEQIQNQIQDNCAKHLIKQLENKITIVQPITYFQSESDIKKLTTTISI
jgi:hypothetical protein